MIKTLSSTGDFLRRLQRSEHNFSLSAGAVRKDEKNKGECGLLLVMLWEAYGDDTITVPGW